LNRDEHRKKRLATDPIN